MPPDVERQPVDVLLELPREPRLADPADPGDEDEMRPALLRARLEEILDDAELALASHERRLEPGRAPFAAAVGDDAKRPEEPHRLRLALELVLAGVLVGDRRLASAARRLADENRARLGGRLDARGRVHEVAGDHALRLRANRHGGLAGEDSGARLEVGVELGHARDEVERGADRALGVVLGRGRGSPDGHDRVADELLHRSAVALDHAARGLEVLGEELPRVLGVATLGGRGETYEVEEEERDQAALGGRCGRLCRWRARSSRVVAASAAPHSPQNR